MRDDEELKEFRAKLKHRDLCDVFDGAVWRPAEVRDASIGTMRCAALRCAAGSLCRVVLRSAGLGRSTHVLPR